MRQDHRRDMQELPSECVHLLDQLCDRFETAWKAGKRPSIESYCAEIQGDVFETLLRELLHLELAYRTDGGEKPTSEEYQARFPNQLQLVGEVFQEKFGFTGPGSGNDETWGLSAQEQHKAETPNLKSEIANDFELLDLGRYQIATKLGTGGFGVVYQVFYTDLQRDLAVHAP